MDLSNVDLGVLLAELEEKRQSLHLSYQSVADACGVSQTTIMRIFKRKVEPTAAMLQKIASAVKYESSSSALIPQGYSPEEYIKYQQELMDQERQIHERRARQQEAHYNMLLHRERRTILILSIILMLLVAAFIIWLIIDVTHPDVGWIQRGTM